MQQYGPSRLPPLCGVLSGRPFGLDSLASAEAAIRKAGSELVKAGGLQEEHDRRRRRREAISDAAPQAVIMVNNPPPAPGSSRSHAPWFSLARAVRCAVGDADPQVVEHIGRGGQGLALTQVVPDPNSRSRSR